MGDVAMTINISVRAVPFGRVQMQLGHPAGAPESRILSGDAPAVVYGQPEETLSCRPGVQDRSAPHYAVPASTL